MSGPSTELFRNGSVAIGKWLCRPTDEEFPGGWIDRPTVVFPRTCVRITQEGEDSILADASVAVLYRGCQEYSRSVVDPSGDRCDWFEVDPDWAQEAFHIDDPPAPDTFPMPRTHVPASAEVYMLQRMLLRHVSSEPDPDPVLVEETLMRLLDTVLGAADLPTDHLTVKPEHTELVEDARVYIALNFTRRLTIADVGRAVGASPFHLARLFRFVTGCTVHRHLTDLRLRAALGELEDRDANIADIAHKLGFASHSHLTKHFHARFGMTPSRFRDQASADLARSL